MPALKGAARPWRLCSDNHRPIDLVHSFEEESMLTRWINYWQALPRRNRIGAAVCLVVVIACIIGVVNEIIHLVSRPGSADAMPTTSVRDRAWSKTEPHLEQADRRAALALDRHLASIQTFLDERKPGCRAFAERLLSLRGKWELVKAEIGDGSAYAAFLQEAFGEHVFAAEDLEKAVSTAVRSYLAELENIDDDLLVRLRADLADEELPRTVIPALRSDQAWRGHYRELSKRVAGDLRTDLAVVAGRELFLWPASGVVTELTLRAGGAAASRLGLSGTILATGAASTWRTLGVGLVVAIVLDAVVSRIIRAAGYDAEEKVAERVAQTLLELGRTITDGDPEARATLEKLRAMLRDDPDAEVRTACSEAIRSIEAGTQLHGLRRELATISAARGSLRKETLRRLLHAHEVNP
jgi:hypothetical protein